MRRVGLMALIVAVAVGLGSPLFSQPAPAPQPAKLLERAVNLAQRERTAPAQIKQQLAALRHEIAAKKYTFTVGYTSALDVPLEQLAATRIPENLPELAKQANALGEELLKVDDEARAAQEKVSPEAFARLVYNCPATCPWFDWRKYGKVPPVRTQFGGTCWDFTAIGAFESNWAIVNNQMKDMSEEFILSCCPTCGSCNGGWWMPVFNVLITKGEVDQSVTPNGNCTPPACPNVPTPYHATAWGFVQANGGIPSVADMKQALCTHGPLAVAVEATSAFQAYTGGVFNEHDTTHGINHGVVLIGWDDTKRAWLIRNSWGPNWGSTCDLGTERGYMWIAYDSNNIGYAAAWVRAKSRLYVLPSHYFDLVKQRWSDFKE